MTVTLADIPARQALCKSIRQDHRNLRRAGPRIRVWANKVNGAPGLVHRGEIADSLAGAFRRKKNVAAPAQLRLRTDHYIARWLMSIPDDPEAKKNVVLTADFAGGKMRWSGILKNWKLRSANGIRYLEVNWIDDLQFLQFMLGPPNPLLPIPIFQFPRVLPIFGPAKWAISLLILLQLIRLNGNLWTLPDDPFAMESWDDLIDWSDWQVLIKANPFDLDDSSTWTMLATRMNRIDTVIADALDDAKLVLTYRRILTVDGETCPVEGVSECANGALVLEVVDPREYWGPEGTATGGGIAGGFLRTLQGWADGMVEDTSTLITDDQGIYPGEYFEPGWTDTIGWRPWLVLHDSRWSSIESEVVWAPATAVSVIVGGDNPLADQIARLTIESIGALIGYFLLAGFSGLGAIAADVVMPFLIGTIFAWLQWENHSRGHQLGWVHLWEIYQQGAENNAWSFTAVGALRAGFLSSKSQTAHIVKIGSGSPLIPGVHFDIGTPVGSTNVELGDIIFCDSVEEMDYEWDYEQDNPGAWAATVGTAKAAMPESERLARLLDKSFQTIANIGVHLVS